MAVVDLHSLVLDIYFIFKCQLLGTEKKEFRLCMFFGHVDKRKKNLKYTSAKKIWFTTEINVL